MLYNSNPNGPGPTPTGSALRWGAMKLMIGETGPGFVVEPGYYPNNSAVLTDQWSAEDNVSAISRIHSIQDGEEKGVYFADGHRKIDLVLAYEGKKT